MLACTNPSRSPKPAESAEAGTDLKMGRQGEKSLVTCAAAPQQT